MRHLNKGPTKVMNRLVRGLGPQEEDKFSARFDRTEGYMALSVEWIGSHGKGEIFSLAHYFEQNGDLMADPEMEFIRAADGKFYPISYRLDAVGVWWVSVELNGMETKVKTKLQAEQADFANGWLANIADQQDIFNTKLDEERPTRLT